MTDPLLRAKSGLLEAQASMDAIEVYVKELRSAVKHEQARVSAAEALASTATRDRVRADQALERALDAERRVAETTPKANRVDDLEEACRKMLSALEKLPVSMDKAGVMQTITPPAIPLYGTYEWKAVMNAKFDLIQAMKR